MKLDLPSGFDYRILDARSAAPAPDAIMAVEAALDHPIGAPDFIADVVLAPGRRIAAVFAGHPEAAHCRGVEYVAQVMLQELPEPVDAVITTGAGYPLDLTFYQSIKGITAASHLVKHGGAILLLAACDEGAGATEFSRMLRAFPSDQRFLDHLNVSPVVPDQWQLEKLALVTRRARVFYYVPGLPPEFHEGLWGKSFACAVEAVAALTPSLPPAARIAVLPEGPYVLARVASAPRRAWRHVTLAPARLRGGRFRGSWPVDR